MKNEQTTTELKTEMAELQRKLASAEDTHARKFAGHVNEGAYEESCQQINQIYQQLVIVSSMLGENVPTRF